MGKPLREFLYVDDLAETIARVVGYQGELAFAPAKPDGTPRKLVDTSRINALGWHPRIGLEEGLRDTYRWYLANRDRLRGQAR